MVSMQVTLQVIFLTLEEMLQNSELKAFKASELELVLYTKTSMGDGTQANNPWLQRITRSNYKNVLG
jgi:hypothetical protein